MVYIRSLGLLFEFDSMRFIYDIYTIELTRGVDRSCAVVYTVSYGLTRSLTVCTIANTIIHGYGTRVSSFKVVKTRLSRMHSNGPCVTRIRPRLVRLCVRFTRMANRISRVFCVRQA